jgi:hypothetical protein
MPINQPSMPLDQASGALAQMGCGCGLPASLSGRLDGLPFEALVWMSRMCPVRRGLCCIRTAALRSVFR